MHLQELNPHVLNSLLCLIGIVACLVLIAGSGSKPARRRPSARRPAQQTDRRYQSARAQAWQQAVTAPRIVLGEDESEPFRQVA